MTQPITNDELTDLLKYHRDGLWAHRWQMDTASVRHCEQTIKALQHYRDLINLIDGREPAADPFQEEPSLPPNEEARTDEVPA